MFELFDFYRFIFIFWCSFHSPLRIFWWKSAKEMWIGPIFDSSLSFSIIFALWKNSNIFQLRSPCRPTVFLFHFFLYFFFLHFSIFIFYLNPLETNTIDRNHKCSITETEIGGKYFILSYFPYYYESIGFEEKCVHWWWVVYTVQGACNI